MNRIEYDHLNVVNTAFFRDAQDPVNKPQVSKKKLYSNKRLGLGLAASAGVIAFSLMAPRVDQPQDSRQDASVSTTPVTLVNGGELFHFVKDSSDDPKARNRSGIYPLSQEEKDDLSKQGYDPNNAQIVDGRINHGPLRRPVPGQDISTGIEPYVEVKMPDGSIYHTPKSNIKNT